MLIQQFYSVYDTKAEVYSPPFVAVNHDVARRLFSAAAGDPQTPIGAHPLDYMLMHVGAWNSQSGLIAGAEKPSIISTGLEILQILKNERSEMEVKG